MESTSFRLFEPMGKASLDDRGIVFALGVIGGKKSFLSWSQIERINLKKIQRPSGPQQPTEVLEVKLRDEKTLAFIGNFNSKDIYQIATSQLDEEKPEESVDDRGGLEEFVFWKLENVFIKHSGNWTDSSVEVKHVKQINGLDYSLRIFPSYIFLTHGMNIESGLRVPLNQISEITRYELANGLTKEYALTFELENGVKLAIVDSKSKISNAFELIRTVRNEAPRETVWPELSNSKDTLLKLSDVYRKHEDRFVKWDSLELYGQADEEGHVDNFAQMFAEIRRQIEQAKNVKKRTKSLLTAVERQMDLVEIAKKSASNLIRRSEDLPTDRIFSSEDSQLFESRKGARVVTRNSQSHSSGGGGGVGVRMGPIGVGGGRYSSSSSSSSKTVYFPAPDELTLIESGKFWVSEKQLTFVGTQFNRQVPFKKLIELEADMSQLKIQIVPQGKEKNFLISFGSKTEFLEAALALSVVSRAQEHYGDNLTRQDVSSTLKSELPNYIDSLRSEVAEICDEISIILTAAGSPILEPMRDFRNKYLESEVIE